MILVPGENWHLHARRRRRRRLSDSLVPNPRASPVPTAGERPSLKTGSATLVDAHTHQKGPAVWTELPNLMRGGGVEELPQCSRGLQPAQARAMNWTEMLDAHTLNSARDADTTFGVAYLSRSVSEVLHPDPSLKLLYLFLVIPVSGQMRTPKPSRDQRTAPEPRALRSRQVYSKFCVNSLQWAKRCFCALFRRNFLQTKNSLSKCMVRSCGRGPKAPQASAREASGEAIAPAHTTWLGSVTVFTTKDTK